MIQPTYITQSETIAGEIFTGIEALKAEVKQMQTGYAAARREVESLKEQLKAVSKQKNESWCKDCTPDNCSGCCTSGDEPSEQTQDFEEDTPPKKFFTVVYELNEANIDKHIKSLDWVAYIYTNLIPEDSKPLVLTPTTVQELSK